MSKSQETTPITVVPNADEQETVVKKENIAKRAFNYVKDHKKAALAVAGLVVLVGVSASLGNSSSNDDSTMLTDEEIDLELEAAQDEATVTE